MGNDGAASLADVANFTTKWYIESGGLVRGSYSGRRLRVAVGVQRRSEGEKDVQCEVRAAREQGDALEMHAHRLGVKGAEALAKELRGDQTIRKLLLSDVGLGPNGAVPVAEILLHNECITDLTLQLNGLGDRGACVIARGLVSGSTCSLRSLAIEEEGVGETGITAIAAALSPRAGGRGPALALLEKLSLRGNPVGTPGAAALAKALHVNSSLECLDLSSCGLTGLGAARLAESLPHNCTLLELRLVRNGIPVVGALALAAGLLHNEGIETLQLGANPCGSEGWLGFARSGGRGAPVPGLVQAISSPPLTSLSLFGTGLGNAGVAEMAHFLVDSKCKLTSLDLGDNHISSVGAIELSKVLPKQTTITTLGLWGNSIGSAGKPDADALARSIQRNKCLLKVALHDNPIEHRTTPMSIIERAIKRNEKHAIKLAKEEDRAASSYLSRSSSRSGSSSRSFISDSAIDLNDTEASTAEKVDLVPGLPLLRRSSNPGQRRKPTVTLGVPGQTPREVRELDASGHTGRTPRSNKVEAELTEKTVNGSPASTHSATATATSFREKLLKHQHPSKKLLRDEHDTYVQEANDAQAMAHTRSSASDDQAISLEHADRTTAGANMETDADEPELPARLEKRKLRTPVFPAKPPRSEATATSLGLIAAAVADAARSVTVFIDNQTTSPLVLTDKLLGPKDGRWTWSDRLVPATVRQNEQVVMASESIGGTSRERRPIIATRAAATVVYKLESKSAETFRGLLRLEGIAAVANASLRVEVDNAQKQTDEPGVYEDTAVGTLLDAVAEAVSSMQVVVQRNQIQVRCRYKLPGADGSEPSSEKLVTGWLGIAVDGTMMWRPAMPGEEIVDKKASTSSDRVNPEPDQEQSKELAQADGKSESETDLRADAAHPKPAEHYDWSPMMLKDLGDQPEILSETAEDGVMSLAFLVEGGAVASLLGPTTAEEESPATIGSTAPLSSSTHLNQHNGLCPSLAQRLGDALNIYGPEWLLTASDGSRDKLQALEIQVLPGYSPPMPQSCSVELSWAHEGRHATARWLAKHRVEKQDLRVSVSVTGAGEPLKNSQDKCAPYTGEEYSQSTEDPHLQITFVVTPAMLTQQATGGKDSIATDDDSDSLELIADDEPRSLFGTELGCTPPSPHLVAQLRYVLAKPERSSLVYFENYTPYRLTLLPSASLCSEGGWSDPNIWDAQGVSHYTPPGPPATVLPHTMVAFGCESTEAKTGIVGRLVYHVHANDPAVTTPGWPRDPMRVHVSWTTPFFGKPTCASDIKAAPALGHAGINSSARAYNCKGNGISKGGNRSLIVQSSATGANHNEVRFVLSIQGSQSTGGLLGKSAPVTDADMSHEEISDALRTMDAIEL